MYSAVSIIDGLKANGEIICDGMDRICCPNPDPSCENKSDCVKGAAQKCKQYIKVYHDYKLRVVLTVRFKVSPERNEGFMNEDDSSLTQMINHGYLAKQLLETA
jgi:hypothetical protein